jgi:hypothetical protein
MTSELEGALRNHMQWFGSYKKSGELKTVPVWLTVNKGQIEFLTPGSSFKVKRLRRNPKAVCYIGKKNGPAISGTAEIISDRLEQSRVYRKYWRIHPILMMLGIGLRVWIEMQLGNRVVVRVQPDEPNPFAGLDDPAN